MKKDKFINVWVAPYNNSLKAQVGRGEYNIELIAKDIIDKLKITQNDRVLDLCCGNGLITKIVAKYCKEVHGVDFSEILIETAKKENKSQNIHYYLKNALNIDELFSEKKFDKAYCYFSFQYFNYKNGGKLIELIARVTKQNGLILIGDIPEKRKKDAYYNTWRKRVGFLKQKVIRKIHGEEGEDDLGWWWFPNQIKETCKKLNLKCEILEQDKRLPHAHYRFDVIFKKVKEK